LSPTAGLDQKEVKRAYKRLALQYHPDVAQETDKKLASERFAKINWAYRVLTGKETDKKATTSTSSQRTSSSTQSSTWEPPHRRGTSSAYSSSSKSATGSTTGRSSSDGRYSYDNYIKNYSSDNNDYDTGGDSLGAIFSDLFKGAALGGGGVFKDFVEFLENTVDGYSSESSSSSSDDIRNILQYGSLEQVGEEMDDTDLVVQQLTVKLKSIKDELIDAQADYNQATRYSEKLRLEERLSDLKARQGVAENYIKQARQRLLKFQVRYKELLMQSGGRGSSYGRSNDSSYTSRSDDPYRSSSSSSSSSSSRQQSTYSSGSGSSGSSGSGSSGSTYSSSSGSSRSKSDDKEDAWKSDSFGSFGRGRGSGRRGRTTESDTSDRYAGSSSRGSSDSYSTSGSSNSRPNGGSSYDDYRSSSSSSSRPGSYNDVDYARQPSWAQQMEDQKRLRELKVDEEFDKLKRDLGLK
jgi:DnaJ domain